MRRPFTRLKFFIVCFAKWFAMHLAPVARRNVHLLERLQTFPNVLVRHSNTSALGQLAIWADLNRSLSLSLSLQADPLEKKGIDDLDQTPYTAVV